MTTTITRIAPWQAAKISAVLYFVLGLVLAIPFAIITYFANPAGESVVGSIMFAILAPVFYAVMGLIFTPLFCWIYNTIAKLVGGLEVTFDQGKA